MIIYGSVVSPFVRKLLGYLGEKGIDFELKGVGIGDPDPGFRAASPLTPEELARAYLQRGWWLRRRRFLRWFHATPTP